MSAVKVLILKDLYWADAAPDDPPIALKGTIREAIPDALASIGLFPGHPELDLVTDNPDDVYELEEGDYQLIC